MAYDLVSHPQRVDTSIDGVVTSTVLEAFEKGINRHPVLLSSSGSLQGSGTCLGIPSPLFSVWDDQVLLRIFADDYAHLLAPQISPLSQQRLQAWSLLNTISPGVAATKLMSYDGPVPKPDADRLLNLWSFLETAISQWSYQQKTEVATLPIVPVEGEEHLSRSSNVVQIGAQSRPLSDDDMGFLLRFVSVADRSWMSQFSEPHDHENNDERVQNASSLLRRLELSRPATIADLIRRAATAVFDSDDPGDNGFTIARLAAQAEISADHNYRFRCRDGRWRSSNDGLIIAPTGPMERLLPESWCDARALDDEYEYGLGISGRGAWRDWAIAKGGLTAFPRPRPVEVRLTGEKKLRQFFNERGGVPPTEQRIQRKSYVCVDHDFDAELWSYWESVSTADSRIWSSVVTGLLDAGQVPTSQAKVFQMGVSQRHELNHQPLRARWVLRLQSLPCVVDTFGRPSIPSELLRVTPQNAFLQDIERFIAPEIDRPENAWLLDLLGVRSDPSTTEVPLTRLRALASVSNPPMSALASLYKTLDRLVPNLDSNRVSELRKAFETERLIFARNGSWQSVAGIVQQDEAGTPGVLTIHREIAELDLSLWDRLGVARRASLDRVLDWLNQMPRFERIDDQTLPLVREVLAAYPSEVWHRCGAWIDMTGRWTPARDLRWWGAVGRLARRLFPKFRQATADVSMLQRDLNVRSLFVGLEDLNAALNYRTNERTRFHDVERPDWLEALANGLQRLKPRDATSDDGTQEEHPDVTVARQLGASTWQSADAIGVVPYLDHVPAGPEINRKALWLDGRFMVAGHSSDYYDELVDVLSGQFNDPVVRQAAVACIERSPNWIRDYLESRFDLQEEAPEPIRDPAPNRC